MNVTFETIDFLITNFNEDFFHDKPSAKAGLQILTSLGAVDYLANNFQRIFMKKIGHFMNLNGHCMK